MCVNQILLKNHVKATPKNGIATEGASMGMKVGTFFYRTEFFVLVVFCHFGAVNQGRGQFSAWNADFFFTLPIQVQRMVSKIAPSNFKE